MIWGRSLGMETLVLVDPVGICSNPRWGADRLIPEAAGIEPLLLTNSNPMMANDFGFYDLKTWVAALPRMARPLFLT